MAISNFKRNLNRILPIGIIYLISGIVYSLNEKGLLGDLDYYPATGNLYAFPDNMLITAGFTFITGLFIGTIETIYLYKVFINRSLTQKLLFKTIIYVSVTLSFVCFNTLIIQSIELQTTLLDKRVWVGLWVFVNNLAAFWSIQVYMAMIVVFTLFYLEVRDNMGMGVLRNFLTGRYHKPIQEERIFMFIDMKSSTSIAEKLGHVKYFELLQEYYADLTGPIVNFSGEIYQYVGDEIVISWKIENGLPKNCLQCFFAMKNYLLSQSQKYMENYGIVPTFKAALHYGAVTTGEIGVIKKDIIFTGDVLNTTARIQDLCNDFEAELLISGQLIDKMIITNEYQVKPLGTKPLRGKEEEVELFAVKAL